MKAVKFGLKVDTFLQGVIMLAGLVALVLFFINEKNGWIALTAFCFLGIYQTLSALIWAVALKEKKRGHHLLHILYYWIGYFPALGLLSALVGMLSTVVNLDPIVGIGLVALYIIGVPIYLACRYFNITFKDMVKANTLHRSFWDI